MIKVSLELFDILLDPDMHPYAWQVVDYLCFAPCVEVQYLIDVRVGNPAVLALRAYKISACIATKTPKKRVFNACTVVANEPPPLRISR
jgi:hypothetical protein